MRRIFVTSCLGLALIGGVPMLAGCEREVSHTTKEEVKSDGTVVKEEKKVTENPNTGDTTKTESKTVDKPPNK